MVPNFIRPDRIPQSKTAIRLQDFLAESGEDELDAEESGAIVFVENRIDLDDFEGNHGLGVGNHFHGEVGFAIGDAAAHRRAHSGRVGGIDEVHVQADGDAGGVVHGVLEGLGHDVPHAALVDVAHSEDMDAGFFDDFAFLRVEIAGADDDDVAGFGFGLEAEKVDELGSAVTHDGGERHAVNVAGGGGFRRIHVAVGVEPKVADLFFVLAEMGSDAGGNPYGDGMVAAENEGEKTFDKRFFDGGGDITAGFGNFLQVLGALFADGHFFGLLDGEIADVFDLKAELFDAGLEARAAKGRGAHVHAAAALAEVHGHADDADFLCHRGLFPR